MTTSKQYSENNLNQYTSRDVPGYVDILGVSFATNTVTANGQAAYRHGEYFRKELPVNNGSAALWTNVIVAATNQAIVTGNVFVAQTPESFQYDLDGNLTSDGRWTYTWDGENRLVNMTSQSGAPVASKLKLDFVYDWMGRRIQKLVSTNSGSAYYSLSTNRFVYDGWNLIGVLNPAMSLQNGFTWGLDLSGALQGAGGVGGLLAVSEISAGSTVSADSVAFDGNGNVAALVSGTNGVISGRYEYGPFGEVIRATGPMARANPFRFATKYQDDETDLLYYGYRYYNASTGRWLSRDPIGESGGANTMVTAQNALVDSTDELGLETGTVTVVGSHAVVSNTGFWNHARGWYMDLRWTPPGDWLKPGSCRPCLMAVWIQDFRRTRNGRWHKDWDESDYQDFSRAWSFSESAFAEMWDQPANEGTMISLWWQSPATFRAKSRVKCVMGLDTGAIYTTVDWGYDWSSDGTPAGYGPFYLQYITTGFSSAFSR